jgi:hypothetical protein
MQVPGCQRSIRAIGKEEYKKNTSKNGKKTLMNRLLRQNLGGK